MLPGVERAGQGVNVRVWAVANQKGGVGKTTTVVALGGLLAQRGHRVLLIDLDPHGSLTSYFRHEVDAQALSAFDMFRTEPRPTAERLRQAILPTSLENVHLMPAATPLATAERQLAGQEGMGLRVARALALLWDDFDFVIIDTPPVLGVLMVNALAACEQLVVPVQTEFLALKGLERMLNTIGMVRRSLKREFPHTIVPTLFDRRTQASVSSLRVLRQTHGDDLWSSLVPVDTRLRDASRAGQPPCVYDPASRGARAYEHLLDFLLNNRSVRTAPDVSGAQAAG